MTVYRNDLGAAMVQSTWRRAEGMAAFVGYPWASCPHYGPDGQAELLHLGAGYYDHVAPGFEYALDAPIILPAGSMRAASFQPYSD
jgi:hypothetical protein